MALSGNRRWRSGVVDDQAHGQHGRAVFTTGRCYHCIPATSTAMEGIIILVLLTALIIIVSTRRSRPAGSLIELEQTLLAKCNYYSAI